jgi:ABC-type branched-subunit amino acid transport system ATPase component
MRAVAKKASLAFFENVNDVERVLRVRTIVSAELGLAGKRSDSVSTRAYLADWGLLEVADATIEELPQPVYDLLGVALAMAHDPELLLVSDIERDMTEHQSAKLAARLCDLAHARGVTVVCGVIDYDLAARFDSATCITDDARSQRQAWERKQCKEVA